MSFHILYLANIIVKSLLLIVLSGCTVITDRCICVEFFVEFMSLTKCFVYKYGVRKQKYEFWPSVL